MDHGCGITFAPPAPLPVLPSVCLSMQLLHEREMIARRQEQLESGWEEAHAKVSTQEETISRLEVSCDVRKPLSEAPIRSE